MLKIRFHQSQCNGGPPMTPNQLRFRASSHKDHLTTNSTGFTRTPNDPSKIKHLQFAKLYPFTRVTNTKSMTPNQLRLRHRASKAFAIYPSDRVRASRQSFTTFYFSFSSFLFLSFCFFFSFPFWKTTLVFQMWET